MSTSDHIGPTIEDTSGRRGIEDRLLSMQLQIDCLHREISQLRKQARSNSAAPPNNSAPDTVAFLRNASTALTKVAAAIEENRRHG